MMTTGSSAAFEGNPPGTVRRAAAGVGVQHRGQPIGTVPVDHEPCQPSGTELSASQPGHLIIHLINVQIIYDAQMQLTNTVTSWPSSMQDSYILSNSIVGNRLQAGTQWVYMMRLIQL